MPVDKKYLQLLKKDSLAYAEKRRVVIKESDDALHLSKRAIFALHRDDLKEAGVKLKNAQAILLGLDKKFGQDGRLSTEGALHAAKEEYVEAVLLHSFLTTKKIGRVDLVHISTEEYLGGLCDLPGELLRYAIKSATEDNTQQARECATLAQEVVGELIEFNLTKNLRHKFDQAKMAVQKIEKIIYEITLKR